MAVAVQERSGDTEETEVVLCRAQSTSITRTKPRILSADEIPSQIQTQTLPNNPPQTRTSGQKGSDPDEDQDKENESSTAYRRAIAELKRRTASPSSYAVMRGIRPRKSLDSILDKGGLLGGLGSGTGNVAGVGTGTSSASNVRGERGQSNAKQAGGRARMSIQMSESPRFSRIVEFSSTAEEGSDVHLATDHPNPSEGVSTTSIIGNIPTTPSSSTNNRNRNSTPLRTPHPPSPLNVAARSLSLSGRNLRPGPLPIAAFDRRSIVKRSSFSNGIGGGGVDAFQSRLNVPGGAAAASPVPGRFGRIGIEEKGVVIPGSKVAKLRSGIDVRPTLKVSIPSSDNLANLGDDSPTLGRTESAELEIKSPLPPTSIGTSPPLKTSNDGASSTHTYRSAHRLRHTRSEYAMSTLAECRDREGGEDEDQDEGPRVIVLSWGERYGPGSGRLSKREPRSIWTRNTAETFVVGYRHRSNL